MRFFCRHALSALAVAVCRLAPESARAALPDPLGFSSSTPVFVAHESDGAAVITITRLNVSHEAPIRYLTVPGPAVRGQSYTPVKDMIDFQPRQVSAAFRIPLEDHHVAGMAQAVGLTLFGPSPIGLASPRRPP